MIRFLEVDGVRLADGPLPVIARTPEGRAMGHVPGWALMTDPDYVKVPDAATVEQRTVLDRVSGTKLLASRSVGETELITDPASGQTLVHASGEDGTYLQWYGESDINPDRWTVWAVLAGEGNRSRNFIILSDPGNSSSGISLSISYSMASGDLRIYEYDADTTGVPQRLSAPAGLNSGGLKLVMATFSIESGLKIFVNGELAAAAPEDRRALTRGYQAGGYRMFRLFRGRYGMAGILNLDLGAPQHVAYRQAVERFLMEKYVIA